MIREAMRQNDRAIDGPDYLKGVNRRRVPSQPVTAVSAMLGLKKTLTSQLLQDLGQEGERNSIGVSDFLGAGTRSMTADREMFQGDQAVVRFLTEPEHGGYIGLFRSNIEFTSRQPPRQAISFPAEPCG